MLVREVMTQPAITITPEASLAEAARVMIDRGIGCLPVVDAADQLVGVLTQSDFAAKEKGVPFSLLKLPQVFQRWLPAEGVERVYREAASRPVREVMSTEPITIDENATIDVVVRTLLKHDVNHVLVLREGRPVGMISRHDLLRLMLADQARDVSSG